MDICNLFMFWFLQSNSRRNIRETKQILKKDVLTVVFIVILIHDLFFVHLCVKIVPVKLLYNNAHCEKCHINETELKSVLWKSRAKAFFYRNLNYLVCLSFTCLLHACYIIFDFWLTSDVYYCKFLGRLPPARLKPAQFVLKRSSLFLSDMQTAYQQCVWMRRVLASDPFHDTRHIKLRPMSFISKQGWEYHVSPESTKKG